MSIKVLIVDDDVIDRKSIIRSIKRSDLDFDITEATDGNDCLSKIVQEQFDCTLLDYRLPDMDGIEVLKKINSHKLACNTAVVMFTGMDDDNLGIKAVQEGAQDYLVKGQFDQNILKKVIKYSIERKKLAKIVVQSDRLFESMFEMSSDLIVVLDHSHNIQKINNTAIKYLGDADHSGKDILTYVFPPHKKLFQQYLKQLESGKKIRFESILQSTNGKKIIVDCSVGLIPGDTNETNRTVLFLKDISSVKRKENQLRKDKELAEFTTNEIRSELNTARKIQQGLFPTHIPQIPGLTIQSSLEQAKEVGGDYYDLIPINSNEMIFVVVDVAGHDIASAFIVGMAKVSFQSHIKEFNGSLVDLLTGVNSDMLKVIKDERFLSAFVAIINVDEKKLRYSKAGHFSQYLFSYSNSEIIELSTEGMLIGAFDDGMFEEKSLTIESNDKLILFTDGIFENRNVENEQFGENRLRDLIEKSGKQKVHDLFSNIQNVQSNFCKGRDADDDVCLVIASLENNRGDFSPLFPKGITPTIGFEKFSFNDKGNTLVTQIIDDCKKYKYSEPFIRHHQTLILRICEEFFASTIKDVTALWGAAYTTEHECIISIAIENINSNKITFFTKGKCKELLQLFNNNFGVFEISSDGEMFTCSYTKGVSSSQVTDEVFFTTNDKGTWLTVPSNLSSLRTFESIEDELVRKSVINANLEKIKEVFDKRSGKPEWVGEELRYYDQQKDSLYKIKIDPLSVIIKMVEPIEPGLFIDEYDLKFILKKYKIFYGVDKNVFNQIVTKPRFGEEVIIATGKPPVNGIDAAIKELISLESTHSPLVKEDGSVDHKVLDLMCDVKAGTEIVRRIPPTVGEAGISVHNRPIDPVGGKDVKLPQGENTRINETNTLLIADIDGFIFQDKKGIHVRQLFVVKGNVDYSTGNIDYHGDVYISGNVLSGFKVSSLKNITINGQVEASKVHSEEGNIECKNAVFGKHKAKFLAGNNFIGEYVQEAHINSKNSISIKKTILNSEVMAANDVVIGQHGTGQIIGGTMTAGGRIKTWDLGNEQQVKTSVIIQKEENKELRDKYFEASNQRTKLKETFSNVENQLKTKSKILKVKAKSKDVGPIKAEIEKLLNEFYGIQSKLKTVEKVVSSLRAEMQLELASGTITVANTVYPNVYVKIGDYERFIKKQMGPTVFYLDDNKLLSRPYAP